VSVRAVRKRHGIPEHWGQESKGGVGADDLAGKPGIDQVRDPAGVVDVGMGEKQVVDGRRWHRPLVERQHGIMALGNAAVHQKIDTAGFRRRGLDEVAGAGDTILSADVGY